MDALTKQAKGEMDVRYIGLVEKRAGPWHRQRQRPLCIGCSVGHFGVTAGTLGAFVRPARLSNAPGCKMSSPFFPRFSLASKAVLDALGLELAL